MVSLAQCERVVLPGKSLARRKIAIHATAENRNAGERLWNVGHWASLINQLEGEIVFIGVEGDRPYYERIQSLSRGSLDLVGRMSLEEVAAYLLTVSLLLCVNSGIMHIGVFVGCPVVAIVGGTPARIILPVRDNVKFVEDPGLAGWDEHAEHAPRISRLNEVMPEMVLEKINELG